MGAPSRIGGHDPCPSETGYVMDELEEAANMTNVELQVLEFGKALLVSSEPEEKFWNHTGAQHASVQSIIDLLEEYERQNPGRVLPLSQHLLDLIIRAITNHEHLVATLLALEKTNSVIYTDRRNDLLVWKRAIRSFDSFLRLLPLASALTTELDNVNVNLEICRVNLYSVVNDKAKNGDDYNEYMAL
jgi:hypothetical protein